MPRIFVALQVSGALEKSALEWRKQYAALPVRWLGGKSLHVTIIPPWEESDVRNVTETLKTLEGTTGLFEMVFTRVTYGPKQREPRLIWAEGEAPDQIFALKHGIERVLMKSPETRPFRLHLMLARFAPEEFSKFSVQTIRDRIAWREPVVSFVLMESKLSPAGSEYTVLGEFRL
jgi:2'-5' RNA ligase